MLLSWFGKRREDYTVGYSSMIILAFGQLFNVALGSTGYILTMAKKESLVMLSIVAGIVVNILLNYLLLPTLGITGSNFNKRKHSCLEFNDAYFCKTNNRN